MKPEVLLEQLEAAAAQLKVRVSYESLQSSVVHGGLCRVKGEYRIIVDKRATAEERMSTLATALAQVVHQTGVDLTQLEISPKLRGTLRMHAPRKPTPAPARRTAAA
jgi:hypothetical protein